MTGPSLIELTGTCPACGAPALWIGRKDNVGGCGTRYEITCEECSRSEASKALVPVEAK